MPLVARVLQVASLKVSLFMFRVELFELACQRRNAVRARTECLYLPARRARMKDEAGLELAPPPCDDDNGDR